MPGRGPPHRVPHPRGGIYFLFCPKVRLSDLPPGIVPLGEHRSAYLSACIVVEVSEFTSLDYSSKAEAQFWEDVLR